MEGSKIIYKKTNNATSNKMKVAEWNNIRDVFSAITSTKQLIKLWYNMKAKAREAKTKENIRHLTGGGPSVIDMDSIDAKVMDIARNVLRNIIVDMDSDINGDENNTAWHKTPEVTIQSNQEEKKKIHCETPIKKSYNNLRTNRIDELKCKILEEELEFKRKIHEEDLKIKILEREYKEKMFKLQLEIKSKELENK
ncbi:hypothetical protein K1T71_014983 [Dendrolimus kikuchii]|nr:hypothetical protein K1T71_014983 [Dendrolimus kikuchii]